MLSIRSVIRLYIKRTKVVKEAIPLRQLSFKEFLELNKYSPNTQYMYLLYESLLPKKINQNTIDNFIKDHNTTVVRALLKLYLYTFLKIKEDKIKIPRFVYKRTNLPNYLTFQEVKKLVDYADDIELKLIIKILFETGLRASEFLSITPEKVNFETLEVKGIGKFNKAFSKNIRPETAELLKIYIEKHKIKSNEKLFDMTRQTLFNKIRKHAEEVLGKKIGVHTLRHSIATYLIRSGLHLTEVQKFLGHSRPDSTMIYITITQEDIKEKLDKVPMP